MRVDKRKIRGYIDRVVSDAHRSISHGAEFARCDWNFYIIGNRLLFMIETYSELLRKVVYRLHRNMEKNFNLKFELLDPYDIDDNRSLKHGYRYQILGNSVNSLSEDFAIYPITEHFNWNHVIDEIDFCGVRYCIYYFSMTNFPWNRPNMIPAENYDNLKKAGCDYRSEEDKIGRYGYKPEFFEKFKEAYQKAYHITPRENCIKKMRMHKFQEGVSTNDHSTSDY